MRELNIDIDKLNIRGGGIALGHPYSATGVSLAAKAAGPFKRVGGERCAITFCVGGPFWLKRILPDKIARYYIYTGRDIPVTTMEKYGEIFKVVPREKLFDTAFDIAKDISQMYPPSLWAYKAAIVDNEKEQQDIIELCDRMRDEGNKKLAGDPNKNEMLAAHREHRKPVYDFSKMQ